MTTEVDRPVDPDLAQQLRRIVANLWMTAGEDRDIDTGTILRRLSREVERIARLVEAS